MDRAATFLFDHPRSGLPLKPGGRKTSITLEAFCRLRASGEAQTMLVVAPLRVARQVWRQEAAKWTQFKGLRFALLHGGNKLQMLRSGADVYLINYEGLFWLTKQYAGRSLPFDVIVFDELSKMQNASSQRHKAMRPTLKDVPFRWGLTGSLFAKGHMGIFGQQLILDDGAALGRYITHYRDKYFITSFDGFSYNLMAGAEQRIVEKLAPYWFYMDASDYSQLPEIVDVPRYAEMDKAERAVYEKMRDQALIELTEGTVTGANAGAVYSKLAQLANGAVYTDGHAVSQVHDLKLDMLEELLDELDGEPLFVAYEFRHDLQRIQERFGERFGGQVPYLGSGTTPKQETQWVEAWNRRELPLLCAHPQSAGHGLNMQEGQAYNVAWFSVTWDWELYDQFVRRVRRSGNDNVRVFNHLLIVRDTIDDLKLKAVEVKDFTETKLLNALNTVISGAPAETPPASNNGDQTMVAKLTRPDPAGQQGQGGGQSGWGQQGQGGGQQQAQQQAQDRPVGQSGWGPGPANDGDQRARIQETIAPQPDRSADARAAFSSDVAQRGAAIEQGDYGATGGQGQGAWAPPTQQQAQDTGATDKEEAPKRRTRTTKPKDDATDDAMIDAMAQQSIMAARAVVIAAVTTSSPDSTVEDIIDATRSLMEFVERG
jgi:hypothetical protein